MVPASKHLDYYWDNRANLFLSPNMKAENNTAYGSIIGQIPEYADADAVREWTALYYALIEEIDDDVGVLLQTLGDQVNNTLVIFTSDHGEMLG
jgi:arylsulfatase A-like enzyme